MNHWSMKKKNSSRRKDDKEKTNGPKSTISKTKKNMMRLGGAAGLSLEAFANAKSNGSSSSNPSYIKKQREFYKNAKCVSKFKKLKQQNNQSDELSSEDVKENGEGGSKIIEKNKKSKISLQELYEKRREEEEKARIEREAIIKAKKEEREKVESHRKAVREKMLKRTRHGQPVMKYRIEHLLQAVQGSN